MRQWLGIQEWLRQRMEPEVEDLPVPSTGRNETFRHGPDCEKPKRPCGCMPTYSLKRETTGKALVREFWVTPHPNRYRRRKAEKRARDAS